MSFTDPARAERFFRQTGFFVRDDFLDPACCQRIRADSALNPGQPARVIRRRTGEQVVAPDKRRVESAEVPIEFRDPIRSRLLALQPAIEKHFKTALTGFEEPGLLHYGAGDFYRLHRDRSDDALGPEFFRRRAISAIAFLNSQAGEPTADSYCGGTLVFYGIVKGRGWEDFGFSFAGRAGLFIAFPADTMHEVQPVTAGRRSTLVTWYYR
jgi:predicted 2-oxoglutarate/Fe(II)-dependent dioxygenase YbiX